MDEYSYWEEEKKSLTIDDMQKMVEKYFKVVRSYIAPGTGVPTFVIKLMEAPPEESSEKLLKKNFNQLYDDFQANELYPLLRHRQQAVRFLFQSKTEKQEMPAESSDLILSLLPKKKEEKKERIFNLNAILLIVTIGTVIAAAVFLLISDPYTTIINTSTGYFYALIFGYTIAILCIIGIHESGHLIACRRHKIKSSYPYFIPFVPPLGTMGAVIVQKSPPRNKDELFDVGLMGPLFGFCVTLLVTLIGFYLTVAFTNAQIYQATGYTIEQLSGQQFPDPFLFTIFERLLLNPIPYNVYITAPGGSMVYMLHVFAFAGWIGCFVTGLNLFPIGQLDGGHVSRAIFGDKYYRYVSWIAFFAMILINWLMAFLVLILSRFSFEHPGPLNDVSPLSRSRKIASITFFVVLFLTVPMGSFWF
jgi:Zn-dependent protease